MAEQYFTANPSTKADEKRFVVELLGCALHFTTDAGTFSKGHLDEGSRILLQNLPPLYGRVADVGCGWGPIGLFAAKKNPGAQLYMLEVNERAAALAKRNAGENEIQNAQVIVGDGRESLPGELDFVLINPPIRTGKAVVYGLFDAAHRALKDGGQMYVVIRKQQGAASAQSHLEGAFSKVERIAREKGFWILRCEK